jgi:glycosyltransferase involved in cell wall biosynthesis
MKSSNIYYHRTSIYIHNSPNSLCEAQILGVPCIACYCGGISSLISHQINGLVVPANDPYELAALISFYSKDIFFLQSISQKAIQTAEVRHNPKRVIEEITDSLQAIIKDAKSNETIIRQ